MKNTLEEVIELQPVRGNNDSIRKEKKRIVDESLNMVFDITISLLPIGLYCLTFYLFGKNVDLYEHIENGSIVWTLLTMLVMGNFKIVTSKKKDYNGWEKVIIALIIIFMLLLLGIYLLLNLGTYDFVEAGLNRDNATSLVLVSGIATLILTLLRILIF